MKAKQLRFKKILVSSDKLAFKGFIIKNGSTVVNVDYTVTQSQLPVSGTLQQLIIKRDVDYSVLEDIIFLASEVHKRTFEIIIDFATEIDFDNIQCVCGDNEKNHFKSLEICYKTQTGTIWQSFNKPNSIPVFSRNGIGGGYSTYVDIISSNCINRVNSDIFKPTYLSSTSSSAAIWDSMFKNMNRFSTGKHFVEMSLLNSNRLTSANYGLPIGLVEADSVYNVWSTTSGSKGYYCGIGANGVELYRLTGTKETAVATGIGPGYANNVNWPEYTVGLFVDLDLNKIKMVINGVYESAWFDIAKTKAGQEFFFYSQLRNMGPNAEFSINYPHKYTYTDLTPDWNNKHFITTEGWKRKPAITSRGVSKGRIRRSYIDWPWTMKARGLLNNEVKYLNTSPQYIWRVSDHNESRWGYGYFKNSVFIDYPPKEPTSKRVMLFSINDNEMQQITWSNPLTGEFEFKNVKMKQPYLIFTYDSDEDFNAVVVGPVYPTLMPKYEGVDLTIRY